MKTTMMTVAAALALGTVGCLLAAIWEGHSWQFFMTGVLLLVVALLLVGIAGSGEGEDRG